MNGHETACVVKKVAVVRGLRRACVCHLESRAPPMCIAILSNSSESNAGLPWFALQIRTGRERWSAQHLRVRGYEVFLPTYQERRQWSDRVKKLERALFSGYLFSRFNRDAVAHLVTTPGVIGVVGDGHQPLAIPDEEIEAIQRIVITRVSASPWAAFVAGQRVRVEVGPLKGLEGVVARQPGGQRLIVSITLLQRAVAVELDPAWLEIYR